ncbi:phosphatase PAP2 family protein [Chitinophaga cymbidii]|uniref:Phospholipid phosphatase n=1 Tax=Chitinophaga cymbidii TaxID=1096750 RepID=A0A512RPW3_9BACT|nr:phosphatase PAP2 family protein [Chitinophaga cymbidii]GEP97738.1 phospholipid phosphatase [Chitinophaga cymbidii]
MNKFISKALLLMVIFIIPGVASFAQKTDSTSKIVPLKFQRKQLFVPATLIVAGFGLNGNGRESIKNEIVEERNEMVPHFRTRLDDYLQFSPLVLTYGFEALGMKPKTDIMNRSVILLKSEMLMLASTSLLKSTSHILRPDGSAYTSFPSGHTAQAFAAATLLAEEYGHLYKWVPYVSYGLASTVGALRMANNKHYLSDVVLAAGIGILSTKVAYWTHQYHWNKRKNKTVLF